jgi:hypothetical protein
MKSLILIFTVLLVFTSCDEVNIGPGPGPLVTLKEDAAKEEMLDLSNPSVFMGSDFGNFFKTLYAQGKFDEMIKYTSKTSIDKFGKDEVLDFYKNDLKFGYEIGKPHSQTLSGDTIILNYNANIIATKRVVRINVVVENDSCKIVLPNKLTNFPG